MTPRRQRVQRRRGPRPVRRRFIDRVRVLLRRALLTLLILGGVAGIGAAGVYTWHLTNRAEFFRLREIEIQGVSAETETEMRALVEDLETGDRTLFNVSPRAIRARLVEHPRLDPQTVSVHRRWPDSLSIEAAERVPVAVVPGTRLMLIDGEGWIIEQQPATVAAADLPLLTGLDSTDLRFGEQVTGPEAERLLSWLGALRHHLPRVHRSLSELNIGHTGEVTARLVGGAVIRLGERDPLEQMPILLTFVREIESDLTDLALLDLRMGDHLVYQRRGAIPQTTSH